METNYEFLNATHVIVIDAISMQHGIQLGINYTSNWWKDDSIRELLSNIYNYKFGSSHCYVTVIAKSGRKSFFKFENNPSDVAEEVIKFIRETSPEI